MKHRTPPDQALNAAQRENANELVLQCCRQCARVQYPPRQVCGTCLSNQLQWQAVDNSGELLVGNALHNSLEPQFQQQLPWLLASVKLDVGPVVLVHNKAARKAGERVQVCAVQHDDGSVLLTVN